MIEQMLVPLDISIEKVSIQNFLVIEEGVFCLSEISAIIGPQASGKSIIAKLIYFGRNYIGEYARSVISSDFSIRSFKTNQINEFLDLFGQLNGYDKPFNITYDIGEIQLCISRTRSGFKPKIRQNTVLDRIGTVLKRDFKRYLKDAEQKSSRGLRANIYTYYHSTEERRLFFESIPSVLFIPAARSFYSTVSEELFTFLASEKRVDSLIAQFGSFYEYAKRKASGEWYSEKISPKNKQFIDSKLKPVIGGEFIRVKSKDYIKTNWGRVPLQSSSSGQQEALPLLFSLLEYPSSDDPSQLLIVEEPEAHLFPEAQKYILDLMVEQAKEHTCKMLFTTHSPYILACLNNYIVRDHTALEHPSETGPNSPQESIVAYITKEGGIYLIMDEETSLIDMNDLDAVSETIASEFIGAIQ